MYIPKLFYLPLLAFIAFLPELAAAQDIPMQEEEPEVEEEADSDWAFGLRLGLNGQQATFRNWRQGGTDALTANASSRFTGTYVTGPWQYSFENTLRYGQSRLEGGEFRKSEDLIRWRNQISRDFEDDRFSLVMNANFNTQFDKGLDRDREQVISRFFAPAYFRQLLGASFRPADNVQAEFGAAMQQTFVTDTDLSTRYGLEEGQSFENEAGVSFVFNYDREVMEDVTFRGYFETFTAVDKPISSTELTFVNEIGGRINEYLRADVEFAIEYNDSVIDELQVKQIISVGITYRLL